MLSPSDIEAQLEPEKLDDSSLDDSSSSDSSSSHQDTIGVVLDGHRPCLQETKSYASKFRGHGTCEAEACTTTCLARQPSRVDMIVSRIRSRPTVPPFHHPLADKSTPESVIVDFDGPDDPYRPINWSTKKKVLTTLMYGLITMSATWASSSYASGTQLVAHEFHVSTPVATLGTSLYLFGFGIGPLLWAPLSEVYGRRLPVMTPMFIAVCFSFATATAENIQTIMLTRFFGAFFASAPMTNTGGVLGDLYSAEWRGIALAGYSMAIVCGPALGMNS